VLNLIRIMKGHWLFIGFYWYRGSLKVFPSNLNIFFFKFELLRLIIILNP